MSELRAEDTRASQQHPPHQHPQQQQQPPQPEYLLVVRTSSDNHHRETQHSSSSNPHHNNSSPHQSSSQMYVPHSSDLDERLTADGSETDTDGPSRELVYEEEGFNVDSFAAEMGIDPADVVRAIQHQSAAAQESGQLSTRDALREATLRRLIQAGSHLGQPNRRPAGESFNNPTLVHIALQEGEHGIAVDDESTPMVNTSGGEGTEGNNSARSGQSQLVFHTSGSNFSSKSFRSARGERTTNTGSTTNFLLGRKKTHFASNVVTDVVVYEVDDEIYVGVEFSRHWIGWVLLLLGLIFEIVFDVHVAYVVDVQAAEAGFLAVQNWVSDLRGIFSCFYLAACIQMGVGVSPSLSYSFSLEGFGITTLMSVTLAGALSLEVLTSSIVGSTHFFTTSILHSVWIVIYRAVAKEMIFFAELVGVAVVVIGFVLSAVPIETDIKDVSAVAGNLLMLVVSLLYAAYFLLQAWLRRRSPTAPMVFNIGLVAPIAGVILGVAGGAKMDASPDGIFGMFQEQNILNASLLAIEGLLTNVFFLGAMVYLDILSVSACYTLKSAFAPWLIYFIVKPTKSKDNIWNNWAFAGFAIVLIGTAIVVYFASVKRRFVARRVAQTTRRRAPNPYNKRRVARQQAAAAVINNEGGAPTADSTSNTNSNQEHDGAAPSSPTIGAALTAPVSREDDSPMRLYLNSRRTSRRSY